MDRTTPIDIPMYGRSGSIACSIESMRSVGTLASFRSIDSRGPRQGRRWWPESTRNSPPRPQTLPEIGLLAPVIHVDHCNPSLRYFCTWPTCKKRFADRRGWQRHEEAVHYNPRRWVCCSTDGQNLVIDDCLMCMDKNVTLAHLVKDHFSVCAARTTEYRTFFRKDQLRQHVRRHVSPSSEQVAIPDKLLQAWESDNPALDESARHCGFCGITLPTWNDRSDHVFTHLSQGICKDAWWPQRLPVSLCSKDSS